MTAQKTTDRDLGQRGDVNYDEHRGVWIRGAIGQAKVAGKEPGEKDEGEEKRKGNFSINRSTPTPVKNFDNALWTRASDRPGCRGWDWGCHACRGSCLHRPHPRNW